MAVSSTAVIIDEKLLQSYPKDDLTENRIPASGYGGQTRKWRKTRRKLFLVKTPLQQKMCLVTTIICLIFIPQPQNAMPIHTHQHNQESTQSLTSAMVRKYIFIFAQIIFKYKS